MTIRAGVIGYPIAHSKSPRIHGYWLRRYGLDGRYDPVAIPPERLAQGVAELVEQGFRGFNVTLPHKEAIRDLCAECDPVAQAVGAVNTVTIRPDGTLSGSNTDVFGFIENIRQQAPGFDWTAGPAAVIGAGGAARAALYALRQQGAPQIRITNRSPDRAAALAQEFGAVAVPWGAEEELLEGAEILVNTTSLGMMGQPPLTIDLKALSGHALVHDIVYAPLMTQLLEQASQRGNPVVTGIGMLLHQARPAFERWFGILPDVTEDLMSEVLA